MAITYIDPQKKTWELTALCQGTTPCFWQGVRVEDRKIVCVYIQDIRIKGKTCSQQELIAELRAY